jgi:phosphoribosylanthranilate isomerase
MSTQFMLVQLYEIQTPAEAEALLALGVDHIGSVILSASRWKDSALRETVRLTRSAGARSSLIPLFETPAIIMDMLDYYRPDILHFCDSVSDRSGMLEKCRKLLILQYQVKKNFPEIAIMRSIPIAPPGFARFVPTLEVAALFEPASDYFLTDTMLIQNTLKTGRRCAPPGCSGWRHFTEQCPRRVATGETGWSRQLYGHQCV